MDPTLSPDGKEMIYIMTIAGKEQLIRRAVDGSSVRQLTSDAADHEDPAWSPDSSAIAFASNRGNQNYQIYTMRPDGSDVRLVAESEGRATAPKWSADGKTIYFTNCSKSAFSLDCQIYAAKLDAFSTR